MDSPLVPHMFSKFRMSDKVMISFMLTYHLPPVDSHFLPRCVCQFGYYLPLKTEVGGGKGEQIKPIGPRLEHKITTLPSKKIIGLIWNEDIFKQYLVPHSGICND